MKKLKKEKALLAPKGWAQLPSELLENIFDRLEERNDILSLRQVNFHWNSVANSILERRTLQLWTNWEPSKRWTDFSTFPEFKSLLPCDKVDQEEPPKGKKRFWKKWQIKKKENATSSVFKNHEMNPFPNNCVCLSSIQSADSTPDSLLGIFGHYLTSLEIGVVWCLTTTQMHNVLQQMPGLKALTILEFHEETPENFRSCKEGSEVKLPSLLPSPNPSLTHLRIGNRYRNDEPHVVQWLIKMFAPQLVSLELKNVVSFRPFDKEWSSELFQGLKRLKMTEPSYCLISWNKPISFTFPLEHLAIVRSHMCGPDSLREIMYFVEKFGSSLLTFHFQYFFRSVHNVPEIKERTFSIFPKLEKLIVFNICQKETNMMDIIRKQFAPRFLNLKTLDLPDFDFGEKTDEDERLTAATEFQQSEEFWKIFPKLETIVFSNIADSASKSHVALKRPICEF